MIIGRREDFIQKIRVACRTWQRQDTLLYMAAHGEPLFITALYESLKITGYTPEGFEQSWQDYPDAVFEDLYERVKARDADLRTAHPRLLRETQPARQSDCRTAVEVILDMKNPFIPNTLSYLFWERVYFFHGERTAKHIFNICGQRFGGQELANTILERDAWLYENVSRPGKKLRLTDKIKCKRANEVDPAKLHGQRENTHRWMQGYSVLSFSRELTP